MRIAGDVTSYGSSVFNNCPIEKFTIGANVDLGVQDEDGKYTHKQIFCTGWSSLTTLEVAEGNTRYKIVDGVLYTADGTVLLCYPAGKTDDEPFTIPEGVTTIGYHAFDSCHDITVNNGEDVTTIAAWAFLNCDNITFNSATQSMQTIGITAGYLFNGCTNSTIILAENFKFSGTKNITEYLLFTGNETGTKVYLTGSGIWTISDSETESVEENKDYYGYFITSGYTFSWTTT